MSPHFWHAYLNTCFDICFQHRGMTLVDFVLAVKVFFLHIAAGQFILNYLYHPRRFLFNDSSVTVCSISSIFPLIEKKKISKKFFSINQQIHYLVKISLVWSLKKPQINDCWNINWITFKYFLRNLLEYINWIIGRETTQ